MIEWFLIFTAVKVLRVLLSFLILAMAMMPCQEEPEKVTDTIELSSRQNAEKHDSPADTCNAFCHCARCPFSVILPETDPLISYKSMMTVYITDLKKAVIHVSFAIWQPPQSA